MSLQNVDGALGNYSYDLLGNRQRFGSSRDGRGASTPLPAYEASYGTETGDYSSDLSVNSIPARSFESELMAAMYEFAVAGETDPEAERFVHDMEQFLGVLVEMRAEGHAFTGSNDYELHAVAEKMQEANPDATEEELVNLVDELMDFIGDWQAARDAELVQSYITPTETTDSHRGLVPLLGARA
jgi:hypothetical protein